MNPVLIELTRGPLVESVHCGAIAIVDTHGRVVAAIGDVETPVFPRSAVKAFQALPLIETGTADALGFGDEEIALAAASHTGTAEHVAIARSMLERTGLDVSAMECGAHNPLAPAAARSLVLARERASALHNNCSGKHAGMLATAAHMGEPLAGYVRADHPVQVRVRVAIEAMAGVSLGPEVAGVDGCSLPNWALALTRLAGAYAAFVTGAGGAGGHREAASRIMAACRARPELVAGPGRLDTEVMRRLADEVFIKTGAEGVYCAGLPRLGLGIAVKIDDGAKRAADLAVMLAIARAVPAAAMSIPTPHQLNWRGAVTGEIRPAPALSAWLDALVL